jgi:hypothetical protein
MPSHARVGSIGSLKSTARSTGQPLCPLVRHPTPGSRRSHTAPLVCSASSQMNRRRSPEARPSAPGTLKMGNDMPRAHEVRTRPGSSSIWTSRAPPSAVTSTASSLNTWWRARRCVSPVGSWYRPSQPSWGALGLFGPAARGRSAGLPRSSRGDGSCAVCHRADRAEPSGMEVGSDPGGAVGRQRLITV